MAGGVSFSLNGYYFIVFGQNNSSDNENSRCLYYLVRLGGPLRGKLLAGYNTVLQFSYDETTHVLTITNINNRYIICSVLYV